MTEDQAERIAKALESIAGSLVRLANPPMVMGKDGDIRVLDYLSDKRTGKISNVVPGR